MDRRRIIGNVEVGAAWKGNGSQQITGVSNVQVLTVPANTKFCTIQVEATTIRFTDTTSVTPSATVGQILHPGVAPIPMGVDPSKLQFYVSTAAAVLIANFYR